MRHPLQIRVECYAGHRAEQEPVRFFIGARAVEVMQVLDRWLDPEHRYFKVAGDDGGTYILRHDVPGDRWQLTFYDAAPNPRRREVDPEA